MEKVQKLVRPSISFCNPPPPPRRGLDGSKRLLSATVSCDQPSGMKPGLRFFVLVLLLLLLTLTSPRPLFPLHHPHPHPVSPSAPSYCLTFFFAVSLQLSSIPCQLRCRQKLLHQYSVCNRHYRAHIPVLLHLPSEPSTRHVGDRFDLWRCSGPQRRLLSLGCRALPQPHPRIGGQHLLQCRYSAGGFCAHDNQC